MKTKVELLIDKVLDHYKYDVKIHKCRTYLDVIYKASQAARVDFKDAYTHLTNTCSDPKRYMVPRNLGVCKITALAYNNNIFFNLGLMEKESDINNIKTVLHELYHTIDNKATEPDADIRADKFSESEFNKVWKTKV